MTSEVSSKQRKSINRQRKAHQQQQKPQISTSTSVEPSFRGVRGVHSRGTIRGGYLRSGPNKFNFKNNIICWFCREKGHLSKNCPKHNRFASWRRGFQRNQPQYSQQFSQQFQQNQDQNQNYPPRTQTQQNTQMTLYTPRPTGTSQFRPPMRPQQSYGRHNTLLGVTEEQLLDLIDIADQQAVYAGGQEEDNNDENQDEQYTPNEEGQLLHHHGQTYQPTYTSLSSTPQYTHTRQPSGKDEIPEDEEQQQTYRESCEWEAESLGHFDMMKGICMSAGDYSVDKDIWLLDNGATQPHH